MPLIGAHGWAEDGRARRPRDPACHGRPRRTLPRADRARPPSRCRISTIRRSARCSTASATRRVVLLGEASHGTSEFYRARAAITRRLIERARLHHRRGRGGLAGRGARSIAMCAHRPAAARRPSRRSSAFRPGCGATPRSRRSSTGCATTTRGRAPERAGRLLRPRPLQPVRLDRARCSTTSTGSIRRRRRSRASVTAASRPGSAIRRPMAARRSPAGYATCEKAVVADAARPARQAARVCRAGRRAASSTPRRTRGWSPTPSATTAPCTTARRSPGTCATATCSNARATCWSARAGRQGGGLGAQLPHRQRRGDRDGPGARRDQHRPALPRAVRRRRRADRLRHRSPARSPRPTTGTGRWRSRPCARRIPTATSGCATTRHRRASCSTCARAGTSALRERLLEPRLERAIGVIYRPETELLEPLLRGASCRSSSTRYVWFDETHAVTPLPAEARGRAGDLSVRPLRSTPRRGFRRRRAAAPARRRRSIR